MKILVVCGGGYVAGKEILMLGLMRALRDQGHEVLCATSRWSDGDFRARLDAARIPSVALAIGFISRVITRSALKMTAEQARRLPGLWRDYRRVLEEFKPDVIVHTNHHHLFLLYRRGGNMGEVFHVHDDVGPAAFHRVVFRWLCRGVVRVIAVSEHTKRMLITCGVPGRKVVVVLNGLEPPGTIKTESGHKLAHESAPVIAMVGQIVPWKGHETLLEALAILRDSGASFRCVIFGRGERGYTEALKRRAQGLGLSESVEWKGFVADQDAIYYGVDICAVPSRKAEAFGLAALEPAFRGIPVVASRRGALPEVVSDGETGLLFEPDDAAGLAACLARLLRDPGLRASVGARAATRARERFTAERMARDFAAVLSEVVAKPVGAFSGTGRR